MPIDEARAATERETAAMFGPVDDVASTEDRTIAATIRTRLYRPHGIALGTLVFFHGGGWALGGLDSHDGVGRFLCSRTPCTVVAVDYALAPEHRFPAALEDAWAATRWAAFNLPRPLAIAGDSSGGNLAAVVGRRARDSGIDLALQLLVYPALDLRLGSRWMLQYLGGRPPEDPEASPLLAPDLAGVAPALILSCEGDDLRPQADAYADRLQHAGVPVRHIVYSGLMHNAYRMPGVLPGARKMLEDSASALAAAFSGR
jgi:acetyl esterase/lipase